MINVAFKDLGRIAYKDAWQYQEKLFHKTIDAKIANRNLNADEQIQIQHHFLLCEHNPVITLGKNANSENVLFNEEHLKKNKIELFHINRGGDVTFHGPGQIVGYPILDLDFFYTDIGRYLREIEEVVILTINDYGLKGERLNGITGVWLDADDKAKARKICAIGIHCSRWVTMHGFAFNVNTDLNYFNYIIPCGINDKQVTSLEKELGKKLDMDEVKEKVKFYFKKVFKCKLN